MILQKHTITNYHISYADGSFNVELFKKENQGSTLYTFDSDLYEILWYSSDHHQDEILNFIRKLHHNLDHSLKNIYNDIGGIFEVFIFKKINNKLLVLTDLYGVNGSYNLINGAQQIFFLNFQNFNQLEVPLVFDILGVQAHFGFGYQITPFPLPYKNICRIHGGKLYEFTSGLKCITKILDITFPSDIHTFSLKDGMNATQNLFFGICFFTSFF